MIRPGAKFRHLEIGTVWLLTLSCALMASANPRDDSAPSSSAKKGTSTHSTGAKKTTAASSHKSSSSSTSTGVKKSSAKTTSKRPSHRKSSRVRGQQKIDPERALAIQQALIREHYLTGEPAGTWNQASEDAMRKYQADHGWQSKEVPDSRALISLGLGPSKDHLLNPESAMTTVPDAPKSNPAAPSSHTSPATGAPMSPSSATPAATSNPATSDPASPQ